MTNSADERLRRLAASVLDGPGDLDPVVRRAIESRTAGLAGRPTPSRDPVPEELETLVDKIALHAYKVTDADIDELKNSGYTEDAIFEAVVAAAIGAGNARFERAMLAIQGEE
jgi:hypothetical protein